MLAAPTASNTNRATATRPIHRSSARAAPGRVELVTAEPRDGAAGAELNIDSGIWRQARAGAGKLGGWCVGGTWPMSVSQTGAAWVALPIPRHHSTSRGLARLRATSLGRTR